MGIRLKINLVLAATSIVALLAAAWVLDALLLQIARRQVVEQARVMLEAAGAVRSYTDEQVGPHLIKQLEQVFLPQTVPAYAATESFVRLRRSYRDYSYKEATLNPTNPRDRATDWEADVVQHFRTDAQLKEFIGERATATGASLFVARPIAADSGACLQCHGTPASAPSTMLRIYGESNGFGWKHGEIVGAQIVSVPMDLALRSAHEALVAFMGALLAIVSLAFIAMNLLLAKLVIRPVARMAADADRISVGDFSVPELDTRSRDEIGLLAIAFNRMRRSTEQAIEMLERNGGRRVR